jgi:hypothetical protein
MAPLMTLNDWILYKNGYLYDNSGNFLSQIKCNPTKKTNNETVFHIRNIIFLVPSLYFLEKKNTK